MAAVEPLLARNPAVRAFVTMWAHGWRGDARPDPYYVATYARDGAFGAAMLREGPVVIVNSDAPAAVAFAHDLADAARTVLSVIGEPAACRAFAATWRERTGRAFRLGMHLRHHMLTKLHVTPRAPGAMRTADDADLDWLTAGALAFAREAQVPDPPHQIQTSTVRRLARRGFRIWAVDAPAAFAGWSPAGADARIAPVYTLPQWRGRGFATALVAALARERMEAGAMRVFLMSDVANPTSNALYARIGFRPVSDEVRLDFIDSQA